MDAILESNEAVDEVREGDILSSFLADLDDCGERSASLLARSASEYANEGFGVGEVASRGALERCAVDGCAGKGLGSRARCCRATNTLSTCW